MRKISGTASSAEDLTIRIQAAEIPPVIADYGVIMGKRCATSGLADCDSPMNP